MMGFVDLIMICSTAILADKRHVALRLSLVNIANLNKVLISEVFMNEDRQLRVIHLILDFEPFLDTARKWAMRSGQVTPGFS